MLSFYKDWVLVQILPCPLEDRQPWQLGDRIGRKWHSILLNYIVPFHLNVFKWRAWLSFKACISSLTFISRKIYLRGQGAGDLQAFWAPHLLFHPLLWHCQILALARWQRQLDSLMAVPSYIVQQRQSCRQCPHQQGRPHPSGCLLPFTRLEWCTTCWPILACWYWPWQLRGGTMGKFCRASVPAASHVRTLSSGLFP